MAVEVPDELLTQTYRCPDCAVETGGDGLRPGSEFNWAKAPRYAAGFRRQSYCKRHQSARNGAAQKKRQADPAAREVRRTWDRANWRRYSKKRNANWRSWYAKHREEQAERYRTWAEANPEKRKVTQDAWRARQKWRRLPSVTRAAEMRKQLMEREQRGKNDDE